VCSRERASVPRLAGGLLRQPLLLLSSGARWTESAEHGSEKGGWARRTAGGSGGERDGISGQKDEIAHFRGHLPVIINRTISGPSAGSMKSHDLGPSSNHMKWPISGFLVDFMNVFSGTFVGLIKSPDFAFKIF
jgi:hypothetical protein